MKIAQTFIFLLAITTSDCLCMFEEFFFEPPHFLDPIPSPRELIINDDPKVLNLPDFACRGFNASLLDSFEKQKENDSFFLASTTTNEEKTVDDKNEDLNYIPQEIIQHYETAKQYNQTVAQYNQVIKEIIIHEPNDGWESKEPLGMILPPNPERIKKLLQMIHTLNNDFIKIKNYLEICKKKSEKNSEKSPPQSNANTSLVAYFL